MAQPFARKGGAAKVTFVTARSVFADRIRGGDTAALRRVPVVAVRPHDAPRQSIRVGVGALDFFLHRVQLGVDVTAGGRKIRVAENGLDVLDAHTAVEEV